MNYRIAASTTAAALAIVAIVGLTGTPAARAHVAEVTNYIKHPALLRDRFTVPSMQSPCTVYPSSLASWAVANGYAVPAPSACQ